MRKFICFLLLTNFVNTGTAQTSTIDSSKYPALVTFTAQQDHANMPPMLTDILEGELAWRQHDGGHTDGPNFRYFIPWATKLLKYDKSPTQ